MTDTTQKPKSEKIIGLLKILFYVSLCSPQLKSVYFFIKNACKPILQQLTDGSKRILVFKRMIGHFIKTPPLKKILGYLDWRKNFESSTKKFKSENKPMTENLQDEL